MFGSKNSVRRISLPVWLVLCGLLAAGCSHEYKSNELRLETYQWNFWPEPEAALVPDTLYEGDPAPGDLPVNVPSCGWEALHRGMGKLVRIPAQSYQHFGETDRSRVAWFHCRHTLPELWEDQEITLFFEGVSHRAEVYLNEQLVGTHLGQGTPFEVDITQEVYYTRDNHLAIRVYDPDPDSVGITGTILVRASGVTPEGELKEQGE